MDRKKKADGLLAGTVLICLLAAPFKETGLLGGGLFHMAFAASVGGIADLFAVSSLFGKPLGISYRTDIIAKRRDQIVDMAQDMVGKELFTEELLEDFLEKNLSCELILAQIENRKNFSCLYWNLPAAAAFLPWIKASFGSCFFGKEKVLFKKKTGQAVSFLLFTH